MVKIKYLSFYFYSVMMKEKETKKLFHLKKKWKKCSSYLFSWNVLPNIFSQTKYRGRNVVGILFWLFAYSLSLSLSLSLLLLLAFYDCRMQNVESIARALQCYDRMADVKRKERKKKFFKKKLSDLSI